MGSWRESKLELRLRRTWPSSILVVALCLSLVGWGCGSPPSPSAPAHEQPCDASLAPERGSAFAYRLRGDRCEGLYMRDVTSTSLRVVSFTEIVEDFDARSGEDLLLRWPAFGDGDTHVRAQSLRPRHYYRMDRVFPAGTTRYSWPVDQLAAHDLKKDELALLVWTRHTVGDEVYDAYLPVRVQQRTEANPMDSSSVYTVILMADVDLFEVKYSLCGAEPDVRPEACVRPTRLLQERGYYPAGRGITISIPVSELEAGRVYLLTVGATRKDGGSASTARRLVHLG